MLFTESDLSQIREHGISLMEIERQLSFFKKGFPFITLVRPAKIADGILSVTQDEASILADNYTDKSANYRIMKFVPASGAASRMFKDIYTYLGQSNEGIKNPEIQSIKEILNKLHLFAFYPELASLMKNDGLLLNECQKNHENTTILDYIINSKGLNYGNLPKGLIKFHSYGKHSRTPIEEHLVEGAVYAKSREGKVRIHFTISPEHISAFLELLKQVQSRYEDDFRVEYEITYSIQKPTTDTIAVDMNNDPYRENDGRLVFRPGGHGALIENLNSIDADIVFINNIDNVAPDHLKNLRLLYKKVIGGLLISYQERIHSYLRKLEAGTDQNTLQEIRMFAISELFIYETVVFENLNLKEKHDYLFRKLNKPVRICGMVKNQGEPGGGPFWIKNKTGEISLQIVESNQVDLDNVEQKAIFSKSTHFNPVDLACGLIDYSGKRFNLLDFIDPSTGFISIKPKDGRNLKAQELPGLWNGAMAGWITLFAEVPLATFNPVKTINDLLRKEHQE